MKMHYVILAIFSIIVVLCVVTLAGCTTHANLRYSCDGPCSGSLTRDVEIVEPEQLKPKGPLK